MMAIEQERDRMRALLGAFLAESRRRQGLSQRRVAQAADIDGAKVSQAEHGGAGEPTLLKIASVLGFESYEALLTEALKWARRIGWTWPIPGYFKALSDLVQVA